MTKVQSLKQLAKMFAKEYAVVSLKFVKSHLAHPDHPHANNNAKALLEKAGFVRGKNVNLPEPNNPCGCTSTICYWNSAYFNGEAPNYYTMKKFANKSLTSLEEQSAPAIADCPTDPELYPAELEEALGEESCGGEQEEPVFNVASLTMIMKHLLDETIKNYLRTLPVDHQRAFCSLFETVCCDVRGVCTLTDEGGTVHTFQAMPLPEDARRYYNALTNMFYNDEEFWGPFILWLEEQSKPAGDSWKKLLQKPYSESLQRSYFFLTDLQQMFLETFNEVALK